MPHVKRKIMKCIIFFFSHQFIVFHTLFIVTFHYQTESHEKASKKTSHDALYKNQVPMGKTSTYDESICSALSHCSSCTQNSNCRFCVLKNFHTSQFLPYTDKTSEKKALKGHCLSLKSTRWDKLFTDDSTLKETAYCGLILPDYYNGITCKDINEGSQFKTYRETLEQIQPYFIATYLFDDAKETTLEEALRKSGDPSGNALLNQSFFFIFLIFFIISIVSFFFGLLFFCIFSCCRACLCRCCCCCCFR